jgi:tetraacyldisaccharide 4'-kinase
MQYFKKFNDIKVAVDENRCKGIEKLLKENQPPQIILLDDAYQHRKIKPGLNILLTDYYNLYSNDHIVPAGNLRDIRKAAKRADIIVVSKSPNVLTPYYKKDVEDSLKPLPHQKIFYSYIEYQEFVPFNKASQEVNIKETKTILLFCGIANTYSLEDYLKRKYNTITKVQFNDHHSYSEKDMDMVIEKYNDIIGKNKAIVTTEKDAMRLINSSLSDKFSDIPIFTIPIKVKFHKEDDFNKEIIDYINNSLMN